MWKQVLKWTLLVGLIAYVVTMFVWARAEARRHICSGIDVAISGGSQVSSITEKSVKDVLSGYKGKIVGQPLHSVNTYEIANYLKQFNSFETVDCMLTTQGKLRVKVTPMVPAIRVFDGGKSYYVNKDGKAMAAISGFHVDVPVVAGRFSKSLRPEYVLPVVRYIQQDSLLSNVVGMISVADKENIILVPRVKGHVINFGDTTRLQEKRDAIRTAYRSILPYKGWETYDTISVKFKGQIVATRKDKTPRFPLLNLEDGDDAEEASLQASEEAAEASLNTSNNSNNNNSNNSNNNNTNN